VICPVKEDEIKQKNKSRKLSAIIRANPRQKKKQHD
jgi:hypothetical protein